MRRLLAGWMLALALPAVGAPLRVATLHPLAADLARQVGGKAFAASSVFQQQRITSATRMAADMAYALSRSMSAGLLIVAMCSAVTCM